ncbi:MAG TPA: DNA alkylation repair protein [Methanocorpusculum sp.]|nr:DNA alkylation repair protein [Methanocorpusculum sp.]
MPAADVNTRIKSELLRLSDTKFCKFNQKLLPGTKNVMGVRLPALREIAKELAKGDWKTYLSHASDDTFEEIMLQGLTIGYVKAPAEEMFSALHAFIPKIDNWSVCDSTAAGLKPAKKYPQEFWNFLIPYLSGTEFEIRFALVMFLDHFLVPEYIDAVLAKSDFNPDGYYAKMALAWLVSVCYVKFPEKTERFLKNCTLDDWTVDKSVQKIKESYRVSDEDKIRLQKMKRYLKRSS